MHLHVKTQQVVKLCYCLLLPNHLHFNISLSLCK